MESETAFLL